MKIGIEDIVDATWVSQATVYRKVKEWKLHLDNLVSVSKFV